MPTTLRLLLLLMLGLFGLQPVSYAYDAPVVFVSGAQNIVAASPETGAPTAESAASAPLNFSRTRAAWDDSESIGLISNFVAANPGGGITPISMDEAIARAEAHVGPVNQVMTSSSGGVQFISNSTDASGNAITNIARFDINPASPHVQNLGPHLNLETQINGISIRTGPLADPHLPIIPSTIQAGDY